MKIIVISILIVCSFLANSVIAGENSEFLAAVNSTGLVGYWPFDDGKGQIAADVSGNNNHGKLVGDPDWIEKGRIGRALMFDKVDDVVTIDSKRYNFTKWSGITVAAWVKHRTGASGKNDIISWWYYTDSWPGKSFLLTHHDIGRYFWEIGYSSRFERWDVTGGRVSAEWTHVAGTYDVVSGTMSLYVNGKQVETVSFPGKRHLPEPSVHADLIIGGQADPGNKCYFDGIIDEVVLYNRALNQNEIKSIMINPPLKQPVISSKDYVTITPKGGNYTGPVTVTLSSMIPDVDIHYTTNFYHTPTLSSPRYTGPFEITSKATVKAKMSKSGKALGSISTAHFNFFKPEVMSAQYDWKPQPEKAALMIVFAHPDDEAASFGGTIPYYGVVRKLPIVAICTANHDAVEKDRMRRKELEYAIWTYGLRNKPLFANFPDNCYGRPVSCCLDSWGLDNIVRDLTARIRKYKPDVIVTHDFHGEYGAPNHIVTALATFDAFFAASNPLSYPEQLDSLEVWQPKKLYAHQCLINSWTHDWNTPYPELDGKTPSEVAAEGILCHFSQQARLNPNEGKVFGLLKSNVGADKLKNDFFENIDVSIYRNND